jgi:hypothetical protein
MSGHGWRATASTILNEMGFKPDVTERQLAHVEPTRSERLITDPSISKSGDK